MSFSTLYIVIICDTDSRMIFCLFSNSYTRCSFVKSEAVANRRTVKIVIAFFFFFILHLLEEDLSVLSELDCCSPESIFLCVLGENLQDFSSRDDLYGRRPRAALGNVQLLPYSSDSQNLSPGSTWPLKHILERVAAAWGKSGS